MPETKINIQLTASDELSAKLEAVNRELKKLDSNFQKAKSAGTGIGSVNPHLDKMKTKLNQTANEAGKLNTKITGAAGGFANFGKMATAAVSAVAAVVSIRLVKSLIDAGGALSDISGASDRLFSRFGVNAVQGAERLSTATRNMTANTELLAAANQILNSKAGQTITTFNQLETIFALAERRASDTGQSFSDMLSQIAGAFSGRNPVMTLSNTLGIQAKTLEELFRNAGIEVQKLGEYTLSAADKVEVVTKRLKDTKNQIAQTFVESPEFQGLLDSFTQLLSPEKIRPLTDAITQLLTVTVDLLNSLVTVFDRIYTGIDKAIKKMEDFDKKTGDFLQKNVTERIFGPQPGKARSLADIQKEIAVNKQKTQEQMNTVVTAGPKTVETPVPGNIVNTILNQQATFPQRVQKTATTQTDEEAKKANEDLRKDQLRQSESFLQAGIKAGVSLDNLGAQLKNLGISANVVKEAVQNATPTKVETATEQFTKEQKAVVGPFRGGLPSEVLKTQDTQKTLDELTKAFQKVSNVITLQDKFVLGGNQTALESLKSPTLGSTDYMASLTPKTNEVKLSEATGFAETYLEAGKALEELQTILQSFGLSAAEAGNAIKNATPSEIELARRNITTKEKFGTSDAVDLLGSAAGTAANLQNIENPFGKASSILGAIPSKNVLESISPMLGVLGPIGMFGSIAAGLLGSFFGKKEPEKKKDSANLEKIAKNTETSNSLLNKIINAPTNFTNPNLGALAYEGISARTYVDLGR